MVAYEITFDGGKKMNVWSAAKAKMIRAVEKKRGRQATIKKITFDAGHRVSEEKI